ncbi:hypothetical protein TNCV_3996181 [Trichonephila clavipes]|nr:hypothetical protein TNCV_3996181 [Trichonephila clavipes]
MGKDSWGQGVAGVVQGGHASTLRLTAAGCTSEDRFHKKETDHKCETLRYNTQYQIIQQYLKQELPLGTAVSIQKFNAGKDELKIVAEELNLTVPEGAKIAGLKNLIVNSDAYKNDKELVQSAIDYALAEIKNKRLDSETKLEFERIKLAQLQKQLELANIQKNLIENSDIQNRVFVKLPPIVMLRLC